MAIIIDDTKRDDQNYDIHGEEDDNDDDDDDDEDDDDGCGKADDCDG